VVDRAEPEARAVLAGLVEAEELAAPVELEPHRLFLGHRVVRVAQVDSVELEAPAESAHPGARVEVAALEESVARAGVVEPGPKETRVILAAPADRVALVEVEDLVGRVEPAA
jgi:hypothetical protein